MRLTVKFDKLIQGAVATSILATDRTQQQQQKNFATKKVQQSKNKTRKVKEEKNLMLRASENAMNISALSTS